MENTKNQENEAQQKEAPKDIKTSKAYKFIVGFVIVVALLIFLISTAVLLIKIVPDTFSLISGVYSSVKDGQTTSDSESETETEAETTSSLFSVSDSFVDIGETVTFSWERSDTNGIYSIAFLCDDVDNVTIEYQDDFITCGDTLIFDQRESEAEVSIISSAKRYVDIPVILELENDEGINTIAELKLTVSNKNPNSTPNSGDVLGVDNTDDTTDSETPVTVITEPQTSIPTTPVVNTTPVRDLSVRMLQAGPVVNGQIVNTSSFDGNSVAAIRFEVRNSGNVSTGSWTFQAVLPTADTNSRLFNSGIQNSLTPGSGVIFTLSFSGLVNGTNQAIVSVDPQNLIAENFEGNNQATALFSVSGGNSVATGSGEADFDVDLIGIGRLSGSRFVETNNLDVDDEIAIKFRVTNIGGKKTADWRFEIDVDEPNGASDLDYRSKKYDALQPGESREITISFDNLDEDGDYDFDIEIDPEKDTDEDRRGNNRLRFDIDIDN